MISDDGRFMLFQDGRGGMEAGQGFSIYLYDFEKASPASLCAVVFEYEP